MELKRAFEKFKAKLRRNAGEIYLATGIAGLPAALGIVTLVVNPFFWPLAALALGSAAVGGLLSGYVTKSHRKAYETFLEGRGPEPYKFSGYSYHSLKELCEGSKKSREERYRDYWERLKNWVEAYLRGELDQQLSQSLKAYKVPCCNPYYYWGLREKAEIFSRDFREELVDRIYELEKFVNEYRIVELEPGEQTSLLREVQDYKKRKLKQLRSYKPRIG